MKTIQTLFLAIVALAFSTSAFGQRSKFEIGVETGPTIGTIRGHWIADHEKPAVRYAGGLTLQYNHTDFLSFRTNIAFERKATFMKVSTIDQNRNGSNQVKVYSFYDYLTVPLLARLNFGNNQIRYFVNGGPYAAYLLNRQTDYPAGLTGVESGKVNNTQFFNRFDFGLTAGIGAATPLTEKLILSVELRNNLGLTNLMKDPAPEYGGNYKINSSSLLVGLACPF